MRCLTQLSRDRNFRPAVSSVLHGVNRGEAPPVARLCFAPLDSSGRALLEKEWEVMNAHSACVIGLARCPTKSARNCHAAAPFTASWPNMARGRLATRPCVQSGGLVSSTCEPCRAGVPSLARPSPTEPCAGTYRLAFYSRERRSWRSVEDTLAVNAPRYPLRHAKVMGAGLTAMSAETVGAVAAASGGTWGRVKVWQYTLRRRRRLRYFYISCGRGAREKNRGDGRYGGPPSKGRHNAFEDRVTNSASAKPERTSPAHWFASLDGGKQVRLNVPPDSVGIS
jgi:hypothetical protein